MTTVDSVSLGTPRFPWGAGQCAGWSISPGGRRDYREELRYFEHCQNCPQTEHFPNRGSSVCQVPQSTLPCTGV